MYFLEKWKSELAIYTFQNNSLSLFDFLLNDF